MTEPLHTNAACSRCGRRFHCGAADSEPCWCVSLTLDRDLLARLNERYRGCLCGPCLNELADSPQKKTAGQ